MPDLYDVRGDNVSRDDACDQPLNHVMQNVSDEARDGAIDEHAR